MEYIRLYKSFTSKFILKGGYIEHAIYSQVAVPKHITFTESNAHVYRPVPEMLSRAYMAPHGTLKR